MPLIRYHIKNECTKRNPELQETAAKDDPESIFRSLAMTGLVNIVRQLGDFAELSAEIFGSVHKEIMAVSARGCALAIRLQNLEVEFHKVEAVSLSESNQLFFTFAPGTKWHASTFNGENQLTGGDLPKFLLDSYEQCKQLPRLFMLDKFEAAGEGACLRRYSDPSYFKMQWENSESKKAENSKKEKKGRRRKKADTHESKHDNEVNLSDKNITADCSVQRSSLNSDSRELSVGNHHGSNENIHGKEVKCGTSFAHIADGLQKILFSGVKYRQSNHLWANQTYTKGPSRASLSVTRDDPKEVTPKISGKSEVLMNTANSVSKVLPETDPSVMEGSVDDINDLDHFVDAMTTVESETEADSERRTRPESECDCISECIDRNEDLSQKSSERIPETKNLKQNGLLQKQTDKPFLGNSPCQSNVESIFLATLKIASAAKDGRVQRTEAARTTPSLSDSDSSKVLQNEHNGLSNSASDPLSISAPFLETNHKQQEDLVAPSRQNASTGDKKGELPVDLAQSLAKSSSVINIPHSCTTSPVTSCSFPNLSRSSYINCSFGDESPVSSLSSLGSSPHSPVFSAFLSPMSPVKASHDMLLLPELQSISFPTVLFSPSTLTAGLSKSSPLLPEEMPPPPPLPPLRWRVPSPHKILLPSLTRTVDLQPSPQLPSSLTKHRVHQDFSRSLRHSNYTQVRQEEKKPSIQVSLKESNNYFARSISGHDKGMLKKVASVGRSPKVLPLDNHQLLLEQIRTRSYTLRQTNCQKKGTPQQTTKHISVAAIFEKANAIRQAFAGSEDDDDDAEWTDSS
ncbi:hypothetical protein O6H91_Y312800 [Diphasiastrum complanatum]|nr:hypothetical protein O6H91_Y312800 [Diphasiastrum complanatum]